MFECLFFDNFVPSPPPPLKLRAGGFSLGPRFEFGAAMFWCLWQPWWNKLVTDWIWQAATVSFQQTCYELFTSLLHLVNLLATNLLQQLATALSRQPWYKSVNKLLQVRQQVATSPSQQAVIGSAKTSCWQVVGADLLQVCCRFVTSCAFLRV